MEWWRAACVVGLVIGSAVAASGQDAPAVSSVPAPLVAGEVEMPRAWPTAVEALVTAHRQTGLRYAVVPARFDGVVGPYAAGAKVRLDKLVAAVAAATGSSVRAVGEAIVFDPKPAEGAKGADELRERVRQLALDGRSDTIPELSKLVGNEDPSISFHALAALYRMEGDFARENWPGRASVFELLRAQLDRQALLWALGEAGPEGGPFWQMAANVLGRAREPYLGRNLWDTLWEKTPGTIQTGLWAIGRSGDITASWAVTKRVRNPFTNDPTDRYLAALALGELGDEGELRKHAKDGNAEVRAAAVLALGLCRETPALLAQLGEAAGDKDGAVRFVACQSLGRVGSEKSIGLLAAMVGGGGASDEMRCAALDGLAASGSPKAVEVIVRGAGQASTLVRAKAAEALGRVGGAAAERELTGLLGDKDGCVRAAAACALGSIGGPAAAGRVAEYLRDAGTDADGQIAAMIGLGRGRSPEAKDALAALARDRAKEMRLRRYAVLALAQLAGRAGQDVLKELSAYGGPQFVDLALRHVELATPGETAEYVAQFLARGHTDVSGAAACRLAELGHGAGVRELLEGYDVFENHARMMHMWGAIRARGPEVVPALVEAAKSRRAAIREGAALALGGRIDVAAADALIELTNDKSAGVRSAAAQSLGLCGDPAAVPALIDLAENDEDLRVVSDAVRALRLRVFSNRRDVRDLFARLAGTERDIGVIPPKTPSLAGQADHSFVLRRWAEALDDEDMSHITYESSVAFDTGRNRLVLWGSHGRRADSPQTGETWFYDPTGNDWERLVTSREWPNETCCVRGTVYDAANRAVIVPIAGGGGGHGWINPLRSYLQHSVPWVLDTATDQWYAAKPVKQTGSLGMVPGNFDARHGIAVWWYGKVSAYDAYANEAATLSPTGAGPGNVGDGGAAFDPETGRLIVVGGSSTWAYDVAANTWTDLKPVGGNGPAGCPVVYDSANDVLLAFRPGRTGGARVSVYHIRENRWEQLPEANPSPRYGLFDCAYDARDNVVILSGGSQSGRSGETTVRETWTYRYKTAVQKTDVLDRPAALTVTTAAGGKALLAWKAPQRGAAAKYRVYRGVGANAWAAKWESLGRVRTDRLAYEDRISEPTGVVFYRVAALDASGKEGPASYPGRTAPPVPRWAAAVETPDGVRVRWSPSAGADVAGYHVYRAAVPAGSYWGKTLDPSAFGSKLERITKEAVKGTEFLDAGAKSKGPASEFEWPDSFAYVVRAVNVWGIESGPSPFTLAVPDAPGPVRVISGLDGRRLVLWSPCRAQGVRGYYVMRMDDWSGKYVFRWHAAPLAGFGFWDDESFPTADRRRYYVNGVDYRGTVGIPSSGAWSHGMP